MANLLDDSEQREYLEDNCSTCRFCKETDHSDTGYSCEWEGDADIPMGWVIIRDVVLADNSGCYCWESK